MPEFTTDILNRLYRQGGNVYRLNIIEPQDLLPLSSAVFSADEGTLAGLTAVAESGERIHRLARKISAVCLRCLRSIHNHRATFAVLAPEKDASTVTICSALCSRWSTETPLQDLQRTAAAYQQVRPALRCVGAVMHPAGGQK